MSLSKDDFTQIRQLIVEGTMEALNVAVNPRLDRIEARLDEHDKHFEQIEAHLIEHDKRFDEHDRRFDEISHRLGNIESRLTSLEDRVEALENDIKELYKMTPAWDLSSDTRLSPEQRLRQLHAGMQALARELKVEL
jgi:chromosome segregation ATPase